MLFLFDNAENQSVIHDCKDWDDAEKHAHENDLTVVGEFVGFYDDEFEYVH